MPVPKQISSMGAAAHFCGTFREQFQNPQQPQGSRGQLERRFDVYLEVAMQSKHDPLMRAHCNAIGVTGRRQDGTQLNTGANIAAALSGFYVQRATTAARLARTQMTERWAGGHTFIAGAAVHAMVQSVVQLDGFQYELSYWYCTTETYILFHCY